MRRVATACLLASLCPFALAIGGDADTIATDPGEPTTITVIGDHFARWDGTRWFLQTQIGMPIPYLLYAEKNYEFEPIAMQIRTTIACEKTWRRSPKRFEVSCEIQDIGLQAAGWRPKDEHAPEILDELDARLTHAKLQLLVADDGRLTNIDLEGVANDSIRQRAIHEQARMLLVRAMAGFHMRLPPDGSIRKGQWVEYNSTLFEIPAVQGANGQQDGRAPVIVNSMGGSYIIHQLDRYQGHNVVQSLGEGTIEIGEETATEDMRSNFKVRFDGVSIYDEAGIMTERVWAMHGYTTAGSWLAQGRADPLFFHTGRLAKVELDAKVDVGPTRVVARPGVVSTTLPAWIPID